MRKFHLVTLSILFFLPWLSSCVEVQNGNSCDDIDFEKLGSTTVDINGDYNISEYKIVSIDNELNLKYDASEIESEIVYDQYAVIVNMIPTDIIDHSKTTPTLLDFIIKPTFACSIASHYVTDLPIENISIISHQDYDETHSAETSLNDYFRISYRPYRRVYENKAISEFVESHDVAPVKFTLYLTKPPHFDGFFEFVATVTLQSGLQFDIEFSHTLLNGR